MRKIKTSQGALFLALLLALSMVACGKTQKANEPTEATQEPENTLMSNAVFTEDTTLGEGTKTITVKQKVQNDIVVFTIKTDKETLEGALLEHGLIDGDEGPYGLYIKVVNGITADYDIDRSYWSLYVGDTLAMSGVSDTPVTDGAEYTLEYTK